VTGFVLLYCGRKEIVFLIERYNNKQRQRGEEEEEEEEEDGSIIYCM